MLSHQASSSIPLLRSGVFCLNPFRFKRKNYLYSLIRFLTLKKGKKKLIMNLSTIEYSPVHNRSKPVHNRVLPVHNRVLLSTIVHSIFITNHSITLKNIPFFTLNYLSTIVSSIFYLKTS